MLKMNRIDQLRTMYYEENYTVKRISIELKISRTSVYKFLHCDDFNPKIRKSRSDLKMLPYMSTIDFWLQENMNAPKKQRYTAKRIFQRLCAEFKIFSISYDTVRKSVKKLRQKYITPFNCYLPLSHYAGEAQADFFDCSFMEKGQQIDGYAFILSFPYSNAAFAQVFKGKTAECMLQGMKNIFEFIGCVPHTIWFDNDVSIIKIREDKTRNFHDFFLRFKNHYHFKSRFCNLRSPNEKGNVEANVRTLRNNLFVPLLFCDDLDKLNEQLLKNCKSYMNRSHYLKKTVISELFNEETNSLLPLPITPFKVAIMKIRKVNNVGRIAINNHYYFIGSQYRLQKVLVKMTYKEVVIFDYVRETEITRFPRLFGTDVQYQIDWRQYLQIIASKINSLKNIEFVHTLPSEIQKILITANKEDAKSIIEKLQTTSYCTNWNE